MSAVLWAALFFETSSDDQCDPDLTVKRLDVRPREVVASQRPGEFVRA
jgi:hypothetical protein